MKLCQRCDLKQRMIDLIENNYGLSNAEIAQKLRMSERNTKRDIKELREETDLKNAEPRTNQPAKYHYTELRETEAS